MSQSLQTPDPWPERELSAQGPSLPDEGPGHTVTLTESEPSKVLLALIVLGAYLFAKYVLETTLWTTRAVAIIAGGIALLLAERFRPSAWKIRLERSQVLLWEGSSPRIVSFKDAKKHLSKGSWAELVASREIALSMSWRRAQLAVWEWLRHTCAGKKHREKQSGRAATQGPGSLPPAEVFGVDANGVRFVDEKVWIRKNSDLSGPETIQEWLLNADELRQMTPNAELILVARKWNETTGAYSYDVQPEYLARGDDGASAISVAIVELGMQIVQNKAKNEQN